MNGPPAADGRGYRALFDDVGDGLIVHDPDSGVVHDVNDRFAELSGFDREAVVGSHVTDLVADDWHPELPVDRLVDGDVDGDDGPTTEWRLKRRDAEPFWAELSASRTELGGETCVLVTVRDVTERREGQRALEERTERLELLNRIVRHDVRNDMQLVQGMAALVGDAVDEDARPQLETIRSRAEHVIGLTDVVGDLTETLASGTGTDLEPTTLSYVLNTEVRTAVSAHPDATIRIGGNVPLVDVVANDMLGSVFRNLLNNAVQHSDAAEPTVTVTAEADDETATVRIADDGPGIDDDRKEAVFGEGEKGLDSEGTGLGLYLVDTLVEGYGGDVRVEDNDPEGSVFVVRLDVAT